MSLISGDGVPGHKGYKWRNGFICNDDFSGDEYSSDDEGLDRELQPLHVGILEVNGINDVVSSRLSQVTPFIAIAQLTFIK